MDTRNCSSEDQAEGTGSGECRWLNERLGSFLDSALSTRQMRRASRHVETCAECRSAAASLEELLVRAGEGRTLQVGPDFEDAIWQRIGREAAMARAGGWPSAGWRERLTDLVSSPGRVAWAGAAMAAVLLVATALL